MPTVLIPLPTRDFDPTEVAVPWKVLVDAGHTVRFATPDGTPAEADDIMITGQGLDPWTVVPGFRRLILLGGILRADTAARAAYTQLIQTPEFQHPLTWAATDVDQFDGLLLPGGHRARGMRPYLESPILQRLVANAFERQLPVAAICHGVLLAARSIDPATGRSVLYGRKTTALTWKQERLAATMARVGRFWEPTYYRTYPDPKNEPAGYMSVQSEVTRALARPDDFITVDPSDPAARIKTDGRHRDRSDNPRPAHVVTDKNYVSARWPGDAHTFAKQFAAMLTNEPAAEHTS